MKSFAIVIVALSLLFAFTPISGGVVQESAAVSQPQEVACHGLLRGLLRGVGRGVGRALGVRGSC